MFAFHQRSGHYRQFSDPETTYGNGEMLHWLLEREITPYMRIKEGTHSRGELYGNEKFTYDPENNRFCPQGKRLNYIGIVGNRAHVYHTTRKRCRDCPARRSAPRASIESSPCTSTNRIDSVRTRSPRHRLSPRPREHGARWKPCFESLDRMGLGHMRLKHMKFVREQFYLAAAAQNMKRLVRFLSPKSTKPAIATV